MGWVWCCFKLRSTCLQKEREIVDTNDWLGCECRVLFFFHSIIIINQSIQNVLLFNWTELSSNSWWYLKYLKEASSIITTSHNNSWERYSQPYFPISPFFHSMYFHLVVSFYFYSIVTFIENYCNTILNPHPKQATATATFPFEASHSRPRCLLLFWTHQDHSRVCFKCVWQTLMCHWKRYTSPFHMERSKVELQGYSSVRWKQTRETSRNPIHWWLVNIHPNT